MNVRDLVRARGRQLFWARIDDARVQGRPSGELIEIDGDYALLRLSEMYLGTTRVLWRKRSPVVHAFVISGEDEQHTVVGPGPLRDVGSEDLARILVLNRRLIGPVPHRGQELTVSAGLYSVPGEDAAAALTSTVTAIADLLGPAAAGAADATRVMKTGIEQLLGLGDTELRLGVDYTFATGDPLRSGFHVGIAAPPSAIDLGQLWIRDGRLVHGSTLMMADEYTEHDYFIVNVQRLDRRPDWPALPGLQHYQERFAAVLSAGESKDWMYGKLKEAWPGFTELLINSPGLTRRDADAIASDVQLDLTKRIEAATSGNPFEVRAWDGGPVVSTAPADFDFAAVPTAATAEPELLTGGTW
jgi:hypothetical protein